MAAVEGTLFFLPLRLLLAFLLVLACIFLGWFFAWKLVLVNVPLVQEVCGLKKKPPKPKPSPRHFRQIYNAKHG